MKKILIILLSGIIIFNLAACSSADSSSKGTDEKEKSTQSTGQDKAPKEEVSIEIDPPSGWEPVVGSVLQVQYMKGTASFMVKKEGLFSGKTADDVVLEAKEIFSKTFKDVSYEGEKKAVTINGKDARQIKFTCTVGKIKMKYEYVYLLVGGSVYAITFGDLADNFDSLSKDYEQILKEIKFK